MQPMLALSEQLAVVLFDVSSDRVGMSLSECHYKPLGMPYIEM